MADNETMKNLQKALHMELTAAHQYQLHSHVLDDWGLDKLAAQMRKELHEELGHSDQFIERILFLRGDPDLEFYKKPKKADSLVEMFKSDLADEEEAIEFYTQASQHATEESDIGTRTLFEKIVLDEEGHKAWLELQLSLIDRLGEKAYSAKYVSGAGSDE
ncbi:bacterioferritin (cytochrome b1) [Hoeflea sp. IMCC20628]|uniref:bacterioferritin n=1 Tax=Hoeflea sp. IMCC20628 TaxID=1620421 RepID=UPI00063AEC2F|nr:bacterioferritin [Hoeflea sp. IMCC20628]AKH99842.1 bacterioferritin (cytochrome b1) [Hoeflea sp. IMCC20628]